MELEPSSSISSKAFLISSSVISMELLQIFFMRTENSLRLRLPFFLSKSLKTFHKVRLFLLMILYSFSKQLLILRLTSGEILLKVSLPSCRFSKVGTESNCDWIFMPFSVRIDLSSSTEMVPLWSTSVFLKT